MFQYDKAQKATSRSKISAGSKITVTICRVCCSTEFPVRRSRHSFCYEPCSLPFTLRYSISNLKSKLRQLREFTGQKDSAPPVWVLHVCYFQNIQPSFRFSYSRPPNNSSFSLKLVTMHVTAINNDCLTTKPIIYY